MNATTAARRTQSGTAPRAVPPAAYAEAYARTDSGRGRGTEQTLGGGSVLDRLERGENPMRSVWETDPLGVMGRFGNTSGMRVPRGLDLSDVVAEPMLSDAGAEADTGQASPRDPSYRHVTEQGFTCQGCGLVTGPSRGDAWGGLRVRHLDGDPENDDRANCQTLCPYCHALVHFDVVLARGEATWRFLWLPDIPQSFLTLFAHARAVVELRARRTLERRLLDPEGTRTRGEEHELVVRRRFDELSRFLERLTLPRGILLLPDGADAAPLFAKRPGLAAELLGKRVRAATPDERRHLARALAPLRVLFDWRHHPCPASLSDSATWDPSPAWATAWLEVARDDLRALRQEAPPAGRERRA